MARTVKCPHCSAPGSISPVEPEEHAFAGRGPIDGKATMVCLRCKRGLFLGMFSGLMFGQPDPIPDELWARMSAIWLEREGRPIYEQPTV